MRHEALDCGRLHCRGHPCSSALSEVTRALRHVVVQNGTARTRSARYSSAMSEKIIATDPAGRRRLFVLAAAVVLSGAVLSGLRWTF